MKIKDIFKSKRILAIASAIILTVSVIPTTPVFAETTETTEETENTTESATSSMASTENSVVDMSSVVITIKNVDESARIPNAIISVSDSSKKLGFEKVSDGLYVYPGSDKALVADEYGDVTIQGLPIGTYSVSDAGTEDKYIFSSADMFTLSTSDAKIATTVQYKSNSGTLELTFIDGDDKSTIAKGRFIIKNSDGKEIDVTSINGIYEYSQSKSGAAEFITNSSGKATVIKLPAGTYILEEVYAPSKYNSGYVTQEFSITSQQTTAVTIVNTKDYGDLSFNLVSNIDSSKINGAVFQIVNEEGYALPMYESSDNVYYYDRTGENTEIKIKSTNSNVVVIGLPEGTYTIHNKTAATNFSKAGDTKFNILKGQQTSLSLTAKRATGSLSIIKKDETTGDPLEGFKMSILDSSSKEPMYFVLKDGVYVYTLEKSENTITELVTDKNGKILATGIPVGKVLIQEIASTEGYVYNRVPVEKEVTEGVETEVSSPASKSNCAIDIVDENGVALKGVKVVVKNENKEVLSSETNENGKILMSNISEGDYTYTIIGVPNGFAMPEQPTYEFTVDEKGNATGLDTIKIETRKVLVKINISDDMDIDKIEFTMTSSDGTEITAKPGKDGIAVFDNVVAGRYVLTLSSIPDGYETVEIAEEITISENELNSSDAIEFKLNATQIEEPIPEKNNNSLTFVIVFLIILLVACIGGIVFVFIKNKKTNNEENNDSDNDEPIVIPQDVDVQATEEINSDESVANISDETIESDEPVVIEEQIESPVVETSVEDRKPQKQSQPLDPFQEVDANSSNSENDK